MSLFGSSSPYNISLSSQARRSRDFQELNRGRSQGYLTQFNNLYRDAVLPQTLDFTRNQLSRLSGTGGGFFDQFQGMLDKRDADFERGLATFRGGLADASRSVNQGRDAALASAQQNYDDQIRLQSAGLNDSLTARGFGGSTLNEAGIAQSIAPNAIGGLLNAQASIENSTADRLLGLRTSSLGNLANLISSRSAGDLSAAGLFSDYSQGMLDRQLGINDQGFQRRLDAIAAPTRFAADRLVRPEVMFPQHTLRSDIAQRIGPPQESPLLGLAGSLGGAALGGLTFGLGSGALGLGGAAAGAGAASAGSAAAGAASAGAAASGFGSPLFGAFGGFY